MGGTDIANGTPDGYGHEDIAPNSRESGRKACVYAHVVAGASGSDNGNTCLGIEQLSLQAPIGWLVVVNHSCKTGRSK